MLSFKASVKIFCLLTGGSLLFSCSKSEFKIKGEIIGGEEKPLVLEKSGFRGDWIPIDSVTTNKNGGFSISFPSPQSPEIFRLVSNGRYIYFPVDSTETITINSSYENFGGDFIIAGTKNAERMAQFEKELQKINASQPDSLETFKRQVYTKYMQQLPGSIVSYYILTKTIDGRPLYNLAEPSDRKYFSAVATGFKTVRPDAPQAQLLEQTAIQAQKEKNKEAGLYQSVEAQEISLIDIDCQDETGKYVKLSDVAGKGKPVVVIFSLLNQQDSPELNRALAEIYRKKGNIEFYNISLDADQYQWREAAKNLPWITVYSPGQETSQDAVRYNVYQVPSFYIYNSEGELMKRPLTLEELDKEL